MRRSFWAWGWEERLPSAEALRSAGDQLSALCGRPPEQARPLPRLEVAIAGLPRSGAAPPGSIAAFCDASPEARVRHAYGRAWPDLVRGFGCDFSAAPDFVCTPGSEEEVARALEACAVRGIAVTPYGGGTSVVGGVEGGGRGRPACALDLARLSGVLELDPVSRAARIQAGTLGSEGILGVITEAWVRLHPVPRYRASATVAFADFLGGARACRAIAQSGLYPANCRLIDAAEAMLNGVGGGTGEALLLLAFESADHPLDPWMTRALQIGLDAGGTCPSGATYRDSGERAGGGASAKWREAFFAAPYLQSGFVSLGILADTFETACIWDRFEALHAAVVASVTDALRRICGAGIVTCRITHLYPDGAAPYFTMVAPVRAGAELEQWREIKAAASEAVAAAGGTITHHHAVGRTHRPWYGRERPEPFAAALRAVKREIDPAGILNPGVL